SAKQSGPLAMAIKGRTASDSTANAVAVADTVRNAAAPSGVADSSETLRQRLGTQLGHMTKYVFPVLSSTIEVVAGLLIIIFMSIYIAVDSDLYYSGLMALFPYRHRQRAGEVLSAIASLLRRWI